MANVAAKWTHKVVKKSRGGNGEWFAFPAAGTFGSEAEAREYAEQFARDQRGVVGTRIVVLTRGGKYVAEYRVDGSAAALAARRADEAAS